MGQVFLSFRDDLRHVIVLAMLVFTAAIAASPAHAARHALVVGNDAYQSIPALEKAVNDAEAVGRALESLGFDVDVGLNLTRRQMSRKLSDLERRVKPGDEVFFFFAGHGVAVGAENYLLPVDMPKPRDGELGIVRDESHAADTIVRRIQRAGAKVAFVVLDACRDNPFAATGTRNIGATRGLARLDAPTGVFVLFSAGIGQAALDRLPGNDANPNSVFTRSLLPLLATPGLSHVDIAKRVQRDVSKLAATVRHRQEPAYYDQIIGEVTLKAGAVPAIDPVQDQLARLQAELARLKDAQQEPDVAMLDTGAAAPTSDQNACSGSAVAVSRSSGSTTCITPGSGESFRDCSECPEMVVVPAGSFMMGSPESEAGRDDDEGRQRRVTIGRPFAVGKFEVTFAEWEACVANGGCEQEPSDSGWGRGRRPVIIVSWNDAQAYLRWLSGETGQSYRLLSEAEWEYVARAGTTGAFSFQGKITTDKANYAGSYTYDGSPEGEYRSRTVEVDAPDFPANPWGLYHVHGNVSEWVEDCYVNNYNGAPSDGSAGTIRECSSRVLRGGSWGNDPQFLRSASRLRYRPGYRIYFIGFRVARTLAP